MSIIWNISRILLLNTLVNCFYIYSQQQASVYILFPIDGKISTVSEVVGVDKRAKRLIHRSEIMYEFPCNNMGSNVHFITRNNRQAITIPLSQLSSYSVKNCEWMKSYQGHGLDPNAGQKIIQHIYVVEVLSDRKQAKIVEVYIPIKDY